MKPIPLLFLGGLAMVGCGRGTPETGAAPEMLRGTVRVTGSEPAVMVVLSRAGQGDLVLTGEWRAELRELDGAEVTVDGRRQGESTMAGFEVTAYRIESISGQRPVVGVLVEREGRTWIEGEEAVPLAVVPEGLRRVMGAKVWVVGRLTDGTLQPTSYGVLRAR